MPPESPEWERDARVAAAVEHDVGRLQVAMQHAEGIRLRMPNYDVLPDGRFIMLRRRNPVIPTVIHVVLNWPEALLAASAAP